MKIFLDNIKKKKYNKDKRMVFIDLHIENPESVNNVNMEENFFGQTVTVNEQAGNIYFLQLLYGLPFLNADNITIDANSIGLHMNFNSNDYFFNPNNQNITPVLRVDNIDEQTLGNTIQQLNTFKQSLPGVNFFQIGQQTMASEPLDYASLILAIQCIWGEFRSDRICQDLKHDRVNTNDDINSHKYVNAAYNRYKYIYDHSSQHQVRYIHPLLFPKIFQLVFPDNYIPQSTDEHDIDIGNYNQSITAHNLQYIQNPNTVLYIYRDPLTQIINNVQQVQNDLIENTPSPASPPHPPPPMPTA